MALMLKPSDLYIMDEPFNGLDVAGVIILKEWINKRKGDGCSFLLSSHIISVLIETCDTLLYIHNGHIKMSSIPNQQYETIRPYVVDFVSSDAKAVTDGGHNIIRSREILREHMPYPETESEAHEVVKLKLRKVKEDLFRQRDSFETNI